MELDQNVTVTDAVNVYRKKHNLPPLKEHSALMKSAQAHSDDMASMGRMNHAGSDGSDPFQRMRSAGYKWTNAGECIGWNYQTPQDIVDGWMGDRPHREIVLGREFTHIGVGETKRYWTGDFAVGMPDDPGLDENDFNLW